MELETWEFFREGYRELFQKWKREQDLIFEEQMRKIGALVRDFSQY
jgi:hypothetical protein